MSSAPPQAAKVALARAPWREPLAALAPFADEPFTLGLLSDGRQGRWSYLLRRPVRTVSLSADDAGDPWRLAAEMLPFCAQDTGAPPFLGGVAGLASYEAGARFEATAPAQRLPPWPDAAFGLYLGLLAFDHQERITWGVGRGGDDEQASARARAALSWLDTPAPQQPLGVLAEGFAATTEDGIYEDAVAAAVQAIADGEIFQANLARGWMGRLAQGVRPFDVAARLATGSPAPHAAYLRLPGLALVSNSPERFVRVEPDGAVSAHPVKGTRPRSPDAEQDRALADALLDSAKDRAENLMIVDLMRNDLSRVCAPGTVTADPLFALESYANVHHLVSTVRGRLAAGRTALDLMREAFPPGSITGAPKLQAMQVIARHEPPRGPYCGSIFWAGFDGALDSSVLIRTVAFEETADGWDFEARAGAGIVADSDPVAESQETWAKISAIRRAMTEAT